MQKKAKVRYAVVGLGHIAQAAVLPAFAHAENSELAALVSDDPTKLSSLASQYNVPHTETYDGFDKLLESGIVDAVYIALPDSLHRDFTVRAAKAGIHILCEKPMAPTVRDCEAMISAAESNDAKLMIAYRLHFEEANLKSVEIAKSGALGDLRMFDAVHSQFVEPNNQRLNRETSRGPLFDMGIYGINAARYLFRDEPSKATCLHFKGKDPRFAEVPETSIAILRFPEDKIAVITASFGCTDVSAYRLVGTKGQLILDPGFAYARDLEQTVIVDGKTSHRTFRQHDQFGPEIVYFSDCILHNKQPEPSGLEGLADLVILEGLYRSAEIHEPVDLLPISKRIRPTIDQAIHRPSVKEPDLVRARSPKDKPPKKSNDRKAG